MHPVDQYANYLRAYYRREKLPIYSKWPPTASKKYIHLAVVKKDYVSKQQADEFTKATLHGNIEDIIREKESLDFSGIGKKEDGSPAQLIIVEGGPGIGKTTFAWKVCRKWSKRKILQQYRLVVLLRLRDKRVREARNVHDLFYHSNPKLREAVAAEMEAINGKSVLLLYEGYDELPGKLQTQESIFLEILYQECLPEATVLITSRPSATQFLCRQFKKNMDQHIEILGFTKADVQSYVQSVIKDQQLNKEFTQYLKCYPHIRGLMYLPLNAMIVTEIYKTAKLDKSQDFVPTTLTELYTSLSRGMLLRYLTSHNEYGKQEWKLSSFSDLPEELRKQFYAICGIAFQGILKDEYIFDDLARDFNTLDLMQSASELYVDQGAVVSHNFFHVTLQEFLAAVHVSQQPPEEQFQYFLQSTMSWKELQGPPSTSSLTTQDREPMTSHITSESSLPYEVLTSSHFQNVLKSTSLTTQDQGRLEPLQAPMTSRPTSESTPPRPEAPAIPDTADIGRLLLETPQLEPLVPQQLLSQREVPPMTNPRPVIPHTLPFLPPTGSLPYAVLTSSHFQNVLKFTAGLTKLKKLPTASLRSILLQDQGDKQGIPLYSLHWLFEAQCISVYSKMIGETTTLTFDHACSSMNHFDYFVLGFALSHINCTWNINLWGSRIGDEGLEMLVAGMNYKEATLPPSLKSVGLNLGYCDISSVGLIHLKEMPEQVTTRITELDLFGNEDISQGLASLLSNLTSLKTLDLGLTNMTSQEVENLAELLSHSDLHNLEYLNLSYSLESFESTSNILRTLCHNTTLRDLDLSGAHVSKDNLFQLTSALETNTTLRKLTLGECNNEHVAYEISSALCHNSTLRTLNLCGNAIGNKEATVLAEMLRENNSLWELDVSNNLIGEEGAEKLARSLEYNSTLEKLNLYGNAIGLRGATALALMLRTNKTLRDLDVSNNAVGEEGATKLIQAHEQNSTLETLKVYDHTNVTSRMPLLHSNKPRELKELVRNELQQGYVSADLTTCLASGPPGVGKSTLECLLFGQIPPEIRISTACIEQAERAVITYRDSDISEGNEWKKVTAGILKSMCAEQMKASSSQKEAIPDQSQKETPIAVKSTPVQDDMPAPVQEDTPTLGQDDAPTPVQEDTPTAVTPTPGQQDTAIGGTPVEPVQIMGSIRDRQSSDNKDSGKRHFSFNTSLKLVTGLCLQKRQRSSS